jgi:hypothetical protein
MRTLASSARIGGSRLQRCRCALSSAVRVWGNSISVLMCHILARSRWRTDPPTPFHLSGAVHPPCHAQDRRVWRNPAARRDLPRGNTCRPAKPAWHSRQGQFGYGAGSGKVSVRAQRQNAAPLGAGFAPARGPATGLHSGDRTGAQGGAADVTGGSANSRLQGDRCRPSCAKATPNNHRLNRRVDKLLRHPPTSAPSPRRRPKKRWMAQRPIHATAPGTRSDRPRHVETS